MKIFMFFINTIYWLWLVIIPTGIMSFIGYWIYVKNADNKPYSILLGISGIILGIVIAEKVRKKYGLSGFFGRLSETPDVEDRNILEEEDNTSRISKDRETHK